MDFKQNEPEEPPAILKDPLYRVLRSKEICDNGLHPQDHAAKKSVNSHVGPNGGTQTPDQYISFTRNPLWALYYTSKLHCLQAEPGDHKAEPGDHKAEPDDQQTLRRIAVVDFLMLNHMSGRRVYDFCNKGEREALLKGPSEGSARIAQEVVAVGSISSACVIGVFDFPGNPQFSAPLQELLEIRGGDHSPGLNPADTTFGTFTKWKDAYQDKFGEEGCWLEQQLKQRTDKLYDSHFKTVSESIVAPNKGYEYQIYKEYEALEEAYTADQEWQLLCDFIKKFHLKINTAKNRGKAIIHRNIKYLMTNAFDARALEGEYHDILQCKDRRIDKMDALRKLGNMYFLKIKGRSLGNLCEKVEEILVKVK